ncbi:MAG: DUF4277 domain-containing protein [Gammaproteobacteria bacterium]
MSKQYASQTLEHLGLVAGMYDELGIGKVLDDTIAQTTTNAKSAWGKP